MKLTEAEQTTEYPRKVTPENMLHLVLMGPPKSGKSHVALNIQSLYKKCVINLDEVVDWHLNMSTEVGK